MGVQLSPAPAPTDTVYLLAWGRLGYGVGVEDLFWSERIWEQVLNGLACGLLFGEVLLVRYLLDPNRTQFSGLPVPLFPVNDPDINHLGRYLGMFWTVSLLALGGFKLLSVDVWGGEVRVWPLFVGLGLSVGLVAVGVVVGMKCGSLPAVPGGPLTPPRPLPPDSSSSPS